MRATQSEEKKAELRRADRVRKQAVNVDWKPVLNLGNVTENSLAKAKAQGLCLQCSPHESAIDFQAQCNTLCASGSCVCDSDTRGQQVGARPASVHVGDQREIDANDSQEDARDSDDGHRPDDVGNRNNANSGKSGLTVECDETECCHNCKRRNFDANNPQSPYFLRFENVRSNKIR